MDYKNLISEFTAKIGLNGSAFGEDDVARIQADDMTLAFMEIPEKNAVLTWAEVATPPPEKLEQLYRLLLEAMFMGRATQGATFSIDNGTIYLHRSDSLNELELESFSKNVEEFLNLVEKWRGVIEAFRADDSTESADETFGTPSFGVSGFMQV